MNHPLFQAKQQIRNLSKSLQFCIDYIEYRKTEERNNNRIARELISTLNRLTKIEFPSQPCGGPELAEMALKENCQIAKDVLEKYGLLDPEESEGQNEPS